MRKSCRAYSLVSGTSKILKIGPYIKGATGISLKEHFCPEVPKREIKMGEIARN